MITTDETIQAPILVVGKTEAERSSLRAVFEREYSVKEAGSSAQALQIIHRETVLAVLCDLDMPGSFEVLDQIGRENELLLFPVFAVTTEEDESAGFWRGGYYYQTGEAADCPFAGEKCG